MSDHALALWVAGSVLLGGGFVELISIVWKWKYSRCALLFILAAAFLLSAYIVICVGGV